MITRCTGLLLTGCFIGNVCIASDFSRHRLFMTPDQRTEIERAMLPVSAETAEPLVVVTAVNSADKPIVREVRKAVTVNGVVVRLGDASAVVWVDGKASAPRAWNSAENERIRVEKYGRKILMAPGQTVIVTVPSSGSDD